MADRGCFIIADITGYTAFMTGSELDHAQDILKTLFDILHDSIQHPLIISNYQGDAILMYAPEGSFIQGQTLLETIENIYYRFAQKLERMQHNTTCTCRACANMSSLDLKMFVHYGEYLMQDMRGKQELAGSDVIVVHRMTKNHVKELTGLKAYALFTEAAVERLGIHELCESMVTHSETYEHLGEVKMRVHCLRTMWAQEHEKRRDFVDADAPWLKVEVEIPVSLIRAWDYLTEPNYKQRWLRARKYYITARNKGRVGIGAMNHCDHGNSETEFTIVDWRPGEYYTEMVCIMNFSARFTTRLTAVADNMTRISWLFSDLTPVNIIGQLTRPVMAVMMKNGLRKDFEKCGQGLIQIAAEDRVGSTLTPIALAV